MAYVPALARPGDHAEAARVATAAGELLLGLRLAADRGEVDPWSLGDLGDAQANRLILDLLAASNPDDSVLSEEAVDDARRLSADRIWIVDPLDGTREFGERDRDDWAVHVALIVQGELAAGAVALPAMGATLSTGGGLPELPPLPAVPRMVVSRTRPPGITGPIRAAIGGALVPMGSAGAKAMAVVRGEAEVYAHAGGQYEWDNCAPAAVAAAAGLWASRLDGSPLVYNQRDPWLPDLLICREEYASTILDVVAAW